MTIMTEAAAVKRIQNMSLKDSPLAIFTAPLDWPGRYVDVVFANTVQSVHRIKYKDPRFCKRITSRSKINGIASAMLAFARTKKRFTDQEANMLMQKYY